MDSLGNHKTYGSYSLDWTRGRLLEKISLTGYSSGTRYKYNENGIRYLKEELNSSGGVTSTTRYYLDGDKIIAENKAGQMLHYYYDQTGPIGINYKGENYYFRKDGFGNIIEVYNWAGMSVGRYDYDAWGNYKAYRNTGVLLYSYEDHVLNANPFIYKLRTSKTKQKHIKQRQKQYKMMIIIKKAIPRGWLF